MAVSRALYGLAGPFVHDLGGQVLDPAGGAVHVAAVQPGHHLL